MKLKTKIIILSIIFILTYFCFLTFFYGGTNNLSPDSADYFNIARNLSEGRSFIHTIKWHFFNDDPVVHNAAAERPPIYPIILAIILKSGGDLKALVYATMLFGAISVGLFFVFLYFKTEKFIPSAIIALLIAFNPNAVRCFVYLWTESLYFFLFVLTLIFLPMKFYKNSSEDKSEEYNIRVNEISVTDIKLIMAGFFAILSYLTRPSGVFLICGIFIWLLFQKQFRKILMFLIPIIVISAVWFIFMYKMKGNPFYSIQKYHAVVSNIRDGMDIGFGKTFPKSFWAYFIYDPANVIKLLEQSFRSYAMELFSGSYLSFLGWFLILIPFAKVGKNFISLFTILGIINYAGHSLVWATHEGFRFMLFSFIPFLPVIIFLLHENDLKEYKPAIYKSYKIIGFCIIILIAFQYYGFNKSLYQTLKTEKGYDIFYKEYSEYFSNTGEEDIISASDPFMMNYYIDRPTIQLPSDLNFSNLKFFTEFYSIRYFCITQNMQDLFIPYIKEGYLSVLNDAPNKPFLILKKN